MVDIEKKKLRKLHNKALEFNVRLEKKLEKLQEEIAANKRVLSSMTDIYGMQQEFLSMEFERKTVYRKIELLVSHLFHIPRIEIESYGELCECYECELALPKSDFYPDTHRCRGCADNNDYHRQKQQMHMLSGTRIWNQTFLSSILRKKNFRNSFITALAGY